MAEIVEINEYTKFLDKDSSFSKRKYHFENKLDHIPLCKVCKKECNFIKFSKGYTETCSVKCSHIFMKTDEYKNRKSEKYFKKYGVYNSMQNEDVLNKIKKTNLEKYGVENVFKSKSIKDKIKKTNLEKYGVENVSNLENTKNKIRDSHLNKSDEKKTDALNKRKKTNLEKYGVEIISKNENVKSKISVSHLNKSNKEKNDTLDKRNKTNLEKYGHENVMQDKKVQNKCFTNANKMIKYLLENGSEILTQGYGIQFINWYVNNRYDISLLKSEFNCNFFNYVFNGKNKIYRPDFEINNKIIEVKSKYTFNLDIEKNYKKFESVLELKKELHLIFYNKKTDLFDVYIFYPEINFSVDDNIKFYKNFRSVTHCYKEELFEKLKLIV